MKAFSWTSGAWVLAITLGLTGASWASGNGGRAYVVNRASNNVSIVNTATREVVSAIKVGTTPVTLALTPDGSKAYVVNFDSNEVSVIDTTTLQVIKTIQVALNPKAMVVTPDGQRAYVASQGEGSISVIDITTDTVLNILPANRPTPSVLALDPDGMVLYVLGTGSSFVSVVDTTTNQLGRIEVGLDPVAVTFSPDGTKAYIANQGENTVSVFDTTTFPPTQIGEDVPVGQGPRSLVVSPDGAKVYVANFLDNTISVISTATEQASSTQGGSSARVVSTAEGPIQVQSTIFVPWQGPWNILLDPSSVGTPEPQALVINRTSNEVGILNLSTDEPEGEVPVGTNPEQGAFDPELFQAIVTNFGSNDISFFDTTSPTESFSVPVGAAPVAVAVVTGENLPVADAGPDQTVRTLSRVTLDGTGSFNPQEDPLSFLWSQTAGPTVQLSDPTSPTPSFRAPLQLRGSVVLSFELVVNDGQANSLPDTVQVTVEGLRP